MFSYIKIFLLIGGILIMSTAIRVRANSDQLKQTKNKKNDLCFIHYDCKKINSDKLKNKCTMNQALTNATNYRHDEESQVLSQATLRALQFDD